MKIFLPVDDRFDYLIKSADREKVGEKRSGIADGGPTRDTIGGGKSVTVDITAPATLAAQIWEGWGTALKPAHEPICVARKPLDLDTVAANVLAWGVGGINVDGCRIAIDPVADASQLRTMSVSQHDGADGWGMNTSRPNPAAVVLGENGRWPANVIHDGIDQEWARFFYCPKTSKRDRNEGLEHLPAVQPNFAAGTGLSKNGDGSLRNQDATARNPHPTVKPTELMRYLCRLVTPPSGLIVDPFAGSGSTGKAAILEGFQFIGFELDPQYTAIANARIAHARANLGTK